jgi:cytochrome c2
MPRQFNAAKPEDRQIAANLAAHVAGDSNPATRPARPATEDELEQGRDLYENLGCIACHKLTPPKEDDEFNRTSLHYVNAKFSPAALKAHLLSPHRHHPTSRMPDFQISEGEASLLVGYLAAAAEGKVEALPELAKADAALGAKQFVEFRCVNCHAEKETTSGSIVHSLFRRPTEGCLSADPTLRRDAPAMHFTREERAAMIAYLKDQPKQYFVHVPARQSQALFEELRCAACHKRDHDQATRIAVLTEESEKGLTPELLPDLTWAGEKLHRRWTEKQIAGQLDYRARPWLKARMPAFPAYAEALSLGLEAEHGVPDTAPLRSSPKRESKENLVEIGRQLTLKENLDCRQCHAIGDLEPMGDEKTKLAPGINFAHIRERLTHDYYLRFTLDPPRWDVSNRMPKLAADGRTTKVTTFYDGDAEKQFEAIWHYLQTVEKPSKP